MKKYLLDTEKIRVSDGRKIERTVEVTEEGLAAMLTAFSEGGIKVKEIREGRS